MFQGQTAWFSSSVTEEVKAIWNGNAGIQRDADTADFLFSDDPSAGDTAAFYKGTGSQGVAVFKSDWIVQTVTDSRSHPPIANYLLMQQGFCEGRSNNLADHFLSPELPESKEGRCDRHDASFSKTKPQTAVSPLKSADDSPSEVNIAEFCTSMSDGFLHVDELPAMGRSLRDFVPGKNGFRVKRKYSKPNTE